MVYQVVGLHHAEELMCGRLLKAIPWQQEQKTGRKTCISAFAKKQRAQPQLNDLLGVDHSTSICTSRACKAGPQMANTA